MAERITLDAQDHLVLSVTERIHVEMRRQRMRQVDLAALLGTSQGAISLMLAGRRPITIERLSTIAAVLDVDPVELMGGARVP